jgi:hypothetical protein
VATNESPKKDGAAYFFRMQNCELDPINGEFDEIYEIVMSSFPLF